MATLSDQLVGSALVLLGIVIFVYYTLWAIVLPFVDATSQMHAFFPPQHWASTGPAILLVVGITGIAAFISYVSRLKARKAKQQ